MHSYGGLLARVWSNNVVEIGHVIGSAVWQCDETFPRPGEWAVTESPPQAPGSRPVDVSWSGTQLLLGIIHRDIKPSNVLIAAKESEPLVFILQIQPTRLPRYQSWP